jgi:hypothetical protein
MSTAESSELADVLGRVKNWAPSLRIALAKEILDSLNTTNGIVDSQIRASGHQPPTPRGLSAKEVQGLLKTDRPPPDDETVDRWIDEHRMEKYG